MWKDSRCVIGICDNDMPFPELHKMHSNVDGDIIMDRLAKDRTVRAAWINSILKSRKQVSQESLHTFAAAFLLG